MSISATLDFDVALRNTILISFLGMQGITGQYFSKALFRLVAEF